jgi:hypothetical protein
MSLLAFLERNRSKIDHDGVNQGSTNATNVAGNRTQTDRLGQLVNVDNARSNDRHQTTPNQRSPRISLKTGQIHEIALSFRFFHLKNLHYARKSDPGQALAISIPPIRGISVQRMIVKRPSECRLPWR